MLGIRTRPGEATLDFFYIAFKLFDIYLAAGGGFFSIVLSDTRTSSDFVLKLSQPGFWTRT